MLILTWCVYMETQSINPTDCGRVITQAVQPSENEHENHTVNSAEGLEGQNKWQRFMELLNRFCAVIMNIFHGQNELDRFHHSVEAIMEARWRSSNI